MSARAQALGGDAGAMPRDGRAYVVVGGKWVAVAHDETDGVPARLDLPDSKPKGREVTGGSAASVRAAE